MREGGVWRLSWEPGQPLRPRWRLTSEQGQGMVCVYVGGGGVIAANVQEDSGGTSGTSAWGPSGQGEAMAIEMGQPRAERAAE